MRFILFIHIASSSIFLGAIISVLTFKWLSERQGNMLNSDGIANLVRIDQILVAPSAGLLTITGILLIYIREINVFSAVWLQLLLILWFLSIVVARILLVPKLEQLKWLPTTGDAYIQKARQWNQLSLILIIVQLVELWLVVLQPKV